MPLDASVKPPLVPGQDGWEVGPRTDPSSPTSASTGSSPDPAAVGCHRHAQLPHQPRRHLRWWLNPRKHRSYCLRAACGGAPTPADQGERPGRHVLLLKLPWIKENVQDVHDLISSLFLGEGCESYCW